MRAVSAGGRRQLMSTAVAASALSFDSISMRWQLLKIPLCLALLGIGGVLLGDGAFVTPPTRNAGQAIAQQALAARPSTMLPAASLSSVEYSPRPGQLAFPETGAESITSHSIRSVVAELSSGTRLTATLPRGRQSPLEAFSSEVNHWLDEETTISAAFYAGLDSASEYLASLQALHTLPDGQPQLLQAGYQPPGWQARLQQQADDAASPVLQFFSEDAAPAFLGETLLLKVFEPGSVDSVGVYRLLVDHTAVEYPAIELPFTQRFLSHADRRVELYTDTSEPQRIARFSLFQSPTEQFLERRIAAPDPF